MKAKKTKRVKAPPKSRDPQANKPNPHHKRDFDQLLDDAIFGVKKKGK